MASSGDLGEVLNPKFLEDATNNILAIDDDHLQDTVCAICDNGGVLICCSGKCFRSFHATPDAEDAQESNCESLCLTPHQLKGTHEFLCKNCLYGRHQCFVCGQLGSSNNSSGAAEVFQCSSGTCGHFYHPRCVAKLLHPYSEANRMFAQHNIAAGIPFICPAHTCDVCKQIEAEKVKDLQFAICRRCPTSYHRKCLPRQIMFDFQVGDDDDKPRAWDSLLPKNRALIYCLKHEIDEELGTPARIH